MWVAAVLLVAALCLLRTPHRSSPGESRDRRRRGRREPRRRGSADPLPPGEARGLDRHLRRGALGRSHPRRQRPDGAEDDAHPGRRRRHARLAQPHRQALQLQQPALLQHPVAGRRRQRLLLHPPEQRHSRHRRRQGRRGVRLRPRPDQRHARAQGARSSATWATAATPRTSAATCTSRSTSAAT